MALSLNQRQPDMRWAASEVSRQFRSMERLRDSLWEAFSEYLIKFETTQCESSEGSPEAADAAAGA